MKCYELIEKLEALSPISYAESWDNVGLLAGRRDKEIKFVYLAVDATDEVIEEVVRLNVDCLLTHHPLIFQKLDRINTDHFIGRRVYQLIRNDICYYAMHTNFDVMGMADAAADELGLLNRKVLDVTFEDDISKEGAGRYGSLPKAMSLKECAQMVKLRFHVPSVRVYGELDQIVEDVAILPGSGGDFIQNALDCLADVYITGDIDHHEAMDGVAQGLSIIDAGHYGLEKIFVPYMRDYFKRELSELRVYTAPVKEPFQVV